MQRQLIDWVRNNTWLAFLFIVVVFLLVRIPGTDSPLHQDEYKWPIIVNPALTEPGGIPHPPVGEFIYRNAGLLIGFDNFRYVPLFFSLFNLFLLFYLVKEIYDKKTALVAVSIFTISFYSVLASLMVDTDGAIMPFFFLLSLIAYTKLKERNYKIIHENYKWFAFLLGALVLGFFVKASFALVIITLAIDFAFEKNVFSEKKKLLKYCFGIIIGAVALVALLFVAKIIFPYFRIEWTLKYWENFARFYDRGWMQTFIQFVKSIFYLSPLLILPLILVTKNIWHKLRPLFIFIIIGLFFYLIAFDFSIGALDRYFQFLVIPLSIISAVILVNIFKESGEKIKKIDVLVTAGLSLVVFSFQFAEHFVPSLHPKSEWIGRMISLKWNFLYPFSGGSGPLGFYISFAFMAVIWIICLIFILSAFRYRQTAKKAILVVMVVGMVYNSVFIEEYLFGKINGSAPKLLKEVVLYIENNPDIEKVTVYNDNGGAEIQKIGKYRKRLYTDPAFDLEEKLATLNQYKEHYLEIDVPRIDPNSVYREYLDSCEVVYNKSHRYISAKVYDCRNIDNL